MLTALEEGLRDRDRLAFLVVALEVAFLAVLRVLVALLAERRRAGFSGVVAGGDAAAGSAARCAGPRPSPRLLASWDRCSE